MYNSEYISIEEHQNIETQSDNSYLYYENLNIYVDYEPISRTYIKPISNFSIKKLDVEFNEVSPYNVDFGDMNNLENIVIISLNTANKYNLEINDYLYIRNNSGAVEVIISGILPPNYGLIDINPLDDTGVIVLANNISIDASSTSVITFLDTEIRENFGNLYERKNELFSLNMFIFIVVLIGIVIEVLLIKSIFIAFFKSRTIDIRLMKKWGYRNTNIISIRIILYLFEFILPLIVLFLISSLFLDIVNYINSFAISILALILSGIVNILIEIRGH
jgi:hypothetical protein